MIRNCFVAMFDILGFRNLRKELGTEGLYQLLNRSVVALIQHAAAGGGQSVVRNGQRRYEPKITEHSCDYRVFSDTVVLLTKDDSVASFVSLVRSSRDLLRSGFMGLKTPFRGAIAWGDVIGDGKSQILIGSAIEEAYLAEQSQVWSGCILTEQCRTLAETRGYVSTLSESIRTARGKDERWLVSYPVMFQTRPKEAATAYSTADALAINWTVGMYEGAAEKSFAPSTSDHAKRIAENTIKFEHWARSTNA
jgi:hypothetical protein